MVSMAIATPLLPFLPLAAKQILLNNFLSDIPSVFLSSDRVDAPQLAAPRHWSLRDVRRFMLVFGLLSTVFDLATFAVLLRGFDAGQAMFQTAWFVVSLLTELVVVLSLRTSGPAWGTTPSRALVLATAVVGLLAVASPYLGDLSRLFGLVPLPRELMIVLLTIVACYLLATEVAKYWFHRRYARLY
jgi:Mg2+-importing ATPase